MRRTPRRITLYWLLLLVPTLVAGGSAVFLLRREQARLDEQARTTQAASVEAIEARARLIAENVETLVGDVQAGLMETLLAIPGGNPNAALDAWQRNNPLVRSTFWIVDERVRRPQGSSPWLEVWRVTDAPWRIEALAAPKETEAERAQRRDVGTNVSQVQSMRAELQETARQAAAPSSASPQKAVTSTVRHGWSPWRDPEGLHLLGWRRDAQGDMIGVEVELAAIVRRLGSTLPREGSLAASFELRDSGGIVLQKKSYIVADSLHGGGGEQAAREVVVPISGALLPGWEVVGVALAPTAGSSPGQGFLLTGLLLVGIFIAAILSGGALLLRDATRSEAEAAQRTSFVANVSHEFKTPLTTIRLYSELLEQGRVRDPDQGAEYLRTIGRETQRLARLVNNALDFSRLEQGRRKYAQDPVDLAAELTRLLDTHAPRLAEAGLVLKREWPAKSLPVRTDRDALEQIVLNLLDNAVKYASAGGEVAVFLEARPGGGALVRVADRGPGVPPAHRELIFEKFYRVDDALTAEKTGAGLGLAIARQLARGLGGDLRFQPGADGGAAFILELP